MSVNEDRYVRIKKIQLIPEVRITFILDLCLLMKTDMSEFKKKNHLIPAQP